jgi:phosphorylcholine metabolism protein LicD
MGGTKQLTGKHAKLAMKMLHAITTILDTNNVPYFLDGGTLLGIIRENRLLPWDTDMDAGISREFEHQLLSVRWKMWLAGYRTRVRRYKCDTGPFKKGQFRVLRIQTRKFLFFKGYSLMDIFVKTKLEDEYFWTVDDKHPVLKACPPEFYDNLARYSFDGKEFNIPADYKGYLTYHYGDWHVVRKVWNFRTDDAVKQVQLW